MTDFEAFWASYPRKVGKLAALREYQKALRLASAADILSGLEKFKRHLPDETRFIPHARTWLFQGRWMDEEDAVPEVKEYWADECQRVHGGTCRKNWEHGNRMMQERAS